MKKSLLKAGLAVGLGLSVAAGAHAQQATGYAAGHSAPMAPGCPSIEWRVLPITAAPANINGVAYFSDMSGISQVKGTVAADGTISVTVTSVSGNGPAGTLTGKRTAKTTHVDFTGQGCSKASFTINRYTDMGAAGGL